MTCFVGVDVSKTKLDAALLTANEKIRSKVFSNDRRGFAALRCRSGSWLTLQSAI